MVQLGVFQVKLGDKYMYFNSLGKPILTDAPSCWEGPMPYRDVMGIDKFFVRELVECISDNRTYTSKAGRVRIDCQEVKDVARILEANSERIPMSQDAIATLTDRWSYEFGMTTIRLKVSDEGEIAAEEWETGVDKLNWLNCFANSFYFIDKFATNSKTRISTKSFYWKKRQYDMEY